MLIFQLMLSFSHVGILSAYLNSNFHHKADCFKMQILKDLDEIKIANISHIKFLIMTGKTGFLLLNKINVLLLALIYP